MIDVKQLIEGRKKVLSDLKAPLRKLDASIEAIQREVERLLKRKRAVPDEEDLYRLAKLIETIGDNLEKPALIIRTGYPQ